MDEKVKRYSSQIVSIAKQLYPPQLALLFASVVLSGAVAERLDKVLRRKLGRHYRSSGIVSALINILFDFISTADAIDEMQDPRFYAYGLDSYYRELNPFLSKHPTRQELFSLKAKLLKAAHLALSAVYAPFGYTSLAAAPLLYRHNMNIARQIRAAKRLGDILKQMIAEGYSEEELELFLCGLRANPQLAADLAEG